VTKPIWIFIKVSIISYLLTVNSLAAAINQQTGLISQLNVALEVHSEAWRIKRISDQGLEISTNDNVLIIPLKSIFLFDVHFSPASNWYFSMACKESIVMWQAFKCALEEGNPLKKHQINSILKISSNDRKYVKKIHAVLIQILSEYVVGFKNLHYKDNIDPELYEGKEISINISRGNKKHLCGVINFLSGVVVESCDHIKYVLVNSYRTLFLRNFRTQLVFDHH
jgi:hypothetical protein